MHAAELVPGQAEFRVFAVPQVQRLPAAEGAGPFVQVSQEAAPGAILGDHHLNGSLDEALQRQRTGFRQMLHLPQIQFDGRHSAGSAGLLPETQGFAVENIQAHVRPERNRQGQVPGQLPQPEIVDTEQIRAASATCRRNVS